MSRSILLARFCVASNFYIEQPPRDGAHAEAAVFPPDMSVYFRVLGALRDAAGRDGGWAPPDQRRATAGPKLEALADAWRGLDD